MTKTRAQRRETYLLLAALLVLPVMISSGSLWIDEGATAIHALQPTFSDWWHYVGEDTGGDAQQPLGMLSSWITGRLVGTGEWQLRSVNVLWGGLSVWFLWRAGRNLDCTWLPLLLVIQPFFWFYTNEARPYALQHACGAALLLALTIFLRDRGRGVKWSLVFTGAAVTLCYTTVLAPVFLVALASTLAVVSWHRRWRVESRNVWILLLGVIVVAPVAWYYVQTFRRGVTSALLWKVDARYLAYVGYELCGASGLGPSLEKLRLFGRSFGDLLIDKAVFCQALWVGALFLCISVIAFAFGRARKFGARRTLTVIMLAPVLVQIAVFFGVGLAIQKNFWPRHLNVAFPFYVAALGLAVQWSFRTANWRVRATAIALIVLLLSSSLRLRYSPVYAKEDYRWAAARAREVSGRGHLVWWVANKLAANYYGLKIVQAVPGKNEAFAPTMSGWTNVPLSQLAGQPLPDDIFVSRSDVHDAGGIAQMVIRENGYVLHGTHPSFEWWSR